MATAEELRAKLMDSLLDLQAMKEVASKWRKKAIARRKKLVALIRNLHTEQTTARESEVKARNGLLVLAQRLMIDVKTKPLNSDASTLGRPQYDDDISRVIVEIDGAVAKLLQGRGELPLPPDLVCLFKNTVQVIAACVGLSYEKFRAERPRDRWFEVMKVFTSRVVSEIEGLKRAAKNERIMSNAMSEMASHLGISDSTGGASVETFASALVDEVEKLVTKSDDIEQLRVQLAGCSVAAHDGSAQQEAKSGSYGWSPAYADVLKLRRDFDADPHTWITNVIMDIRKLFEGGDEYDNSMAKPLRIAWRTFEDHTIRQICREWAGIIERRFNEHRASLRQSAPTGDVPKVMGRPIGDGDG